MQSVSFEFILPLLKNLSNLKKTIYFNWKNKFLGDKSFDPKFSSSFILLMIYLKLFTKYIVYGLIFWKVFFFPNLMNIVISIYFFLSFIWQILNIKNNKIWKNPKGWVLKQACDKKVHNNLIMLSLPPMWTHSQLLNWKKKQYLSRFYKNF